MNWSDRPDYEPQSLRETAPRHSSPPIFNRSVSDERPSFSSRLAGALLPICLTLMVLSLAASVLLVWATYR